MQILSASPQMPYGEDRDKAVAAARFVNDQYAAVVERHPDHFRAFAAIPMPHIDESIAELGRALDELHMVGVAMWYDSVGHGHVPALRCAIDSFGTDRLLLGTDFPYEAGDVFIRAVDYITDPHITEGEAIAILEDNATALFGITTPAGSATT
jgi:predicted TIM-barrel fold metal-dependent hydrolase